MTKCRSNWSRKRQLIKLETEATTDRQTTQFLDRMMMMILRLAVTVAERVPIILTKKVKFIPVHVMQAYGGGTYSSTDSQTRH
jgi:hypothetical protein